ncbi:MAG: adenylate/guanylate cyclase domain-containing protein [Cyanobacteria bacterium J06638_28]
MDLRKRIRVNDYWRSTVTKLAFLGQLTFKSKLILLVVLAGVSSMGVTAGISSYITRQGMRQTALSNLTTVRSTKANQIQTYFQTLQSHLLTLAEDRMVVAAMVELNKEFRQLDRTYIPVEWEAPLQDYFETHYFPRLEAYSGQEARFESYSPPGQAARYLKHHYLSQNPYEPDNKRQLLAADDGSDYSRYHQEYHPIFWNLIQQFGYADLYLINHKTGDVIYSVSKAPDFATNLNDGPYSESSFAQLVETIRENPTPSSFVIADFQRYEPAYGELALFTASPIYNGPHIVGILAIRLETTGVSAIMNQLDAQDSSLDAYLVGADGLLRSTPRFFNNDAEQYLKRLQRQGVPESTLQAIAQFESPMLLQSVNSEIVQQVLGGTAGTTQIQDPRGVSVLSAYESLDLEGLNWGILSQIDVVEAYAPAIRLRWALIAAAIILITVLTFLALVAATYIIRPIRRLNDWADQVVDGDFDAEHQLELEDEIGQLADTLQIMTTSLSHQVAILDQKMAQNEVLISNLVPRAIAKRLKRGETLIADEVKQATIIYTRIAGIADLSKTLPAEQMTELLTRLMHEFDEAAERHGLARQLTPDIDYMATCGLATPCLDHTKRAVDFALELMHIITRPEFGQEFSLGLRLAIHTGPVNAGVVGNKRFNYTVWGESVYLVTQLYAQTAINRVILTGGAHEYLADTYTCIPAGTVTVPNVGPVNLWMLATREKMATRQVDLVQASFATVKPIADQVGALFYGRLFEVRPDFRPLFSSTDMQVQERKLVEMLAIAVEGLRNPEKIIPSAQELGRRHQGYGVEADHYNDVGAALLWTLEQGLGDAFTPEVCQAWEAAYSFLSNVMISAAEQFEPENIGV